jgi:protein ImuA
VEASSLKQAIAAIEAVCVNGRAKSARVHVETGVPDMDETLGGGLARASIHELLPKSVQDLGAAAGFAFGLAARAQEANAHTLYIQHDFTSAETGRPYLPGLRLSGFDTSSLIYLHVPRAEDVLWAMNEALRCRGFSTVIAEFPAHARVLDLTTTRRLTLAAQEGLGFGLILRHAVTVEPNATTTRWLVSARQSRPDGFGGVGAPALHLDLVKNRLGPSGQWQVEWHPHERKFAIPAIPASVPSLAPLHVGLAQPPSVRPDRARTLARVS